MADVGEDAKREFCEQASGLTEAEKDLVLHENVVRLYRLDTSDLSPAA